jgi:hypothetical protein
VASHISKNENAISILILSSKIDIGMLTKPNVGPPSANARVIERLRKSCRFTIHSQNNGK